MKLFCVSDLHSFFTPFKRALDAKGFEPNNPEHLLICCGDVFDRGSESVEIFKYLNSLTNVVLIRGNHEDMLEELLDRGYGKNYDISNGTVNTVVDLVDYTGEKTKSTIECCDAVKKLITPFFNKYVNYFETKNYIFVHGWIPVTVNDKLPVYYANNRDFTYNKNWRNSNAQEWEQARWLNGIKMAYEGFIVPNKTVVCGHWHCSYGHMLQSVSTDTWITEFGEDAIWEPYESEGIIAIDRCTAYTGAVNVLVLEDDLLSEKV